MRETVLEAVLRSADAPSEVQRNRFAAFLKKQYGQEVPLRWEQDPALEKGFRMEVGADLYDWSLEGRLRQFRERLEQRNPAGVSVIPLMREAVRNWQPDTAPEEVGSLTVGDPRSPPSADWSTQPAVKFVPSPACWAWQAGSAADRVGCILFGGSEAIESGSTSAAQVRPPVSRWGRLPGGGRAGVCPLTGRATFVREGYLPIESPAPASLLTASR